jgi:hypothetical protein
MVWKYIGEASRVTPCEYINDTKETSDGVGSACNNGSCPGKIDGRCVFTYGEPILAYRDQFHKVIE